MKSINVIIMVMTMSMAMIVAMKMGIGLLRIDITKVKPNLKDLLKTRAPLN
tara:strand:- start:174 stop:326 length:153 start_codon:yes stop_codon:yes gene_type:complete